MTGLTDIFHPLADDGEGFGQFIFFIIVAVFWAIGAVVKKLKEKHDAEKSEQDSRQWAKRLAERKRQQARQDADADLFEPQEDRSRWQREESPPPLPGQSQRRRIDQFVRPAGQSRSAPSQQYAPLELADDEPQIDSDEVERQQALQARARKLEARKKQQEQKLRRQRQAREKQMDSAPPLDAKPTNESKRVRVAIDDASSARAAIIYHEILSPPKALRDEPAIWER